MKHRTVLKMKSQKLIAISIVTYVLATALGASTAHAVTIWKFSGNPYDGVGPGLGGEVTVTLDDEGTAGTVDLTIDASGLPVWPDIFGICI